MIKPGWVEEMGQLLASKDETVRATAMGVTPRRCFRRNDAKIAASAARGGRLGSIAKIRKRKLSLGHLD